MSGAQARDTSPKNGDYSFLITLRGHPRALPVETRLYLSLFLINGTSKFNTINTTLNTAYKAPF
jgi:hypothetical protein